jgi:DNA-directed RNA polymerase specialized sigma subunit
VVALPGFFGTPLVMRSRFLEGLTLRQIGESLGITRQAVFLQLQDGLRSARRIAEE